MTSSTSSSESPDNGPSEGSTRTSGHFYANIDGAEVWLPEGPDLPGDPVHRDPAACILILLVSISVLFVLFRCDPRPAAAPDWFFVQKMEWSGSAGTVLAGDSRVYRGLAPVEMAGALPGPVLNLGFSSTKYSDEYLAYVRSVIDDESDPRVVVLGITPFSFTSREAGFEDALTKNRDRRVPLWLLRATNLEYVLAPIDPTLFVSMAGLSANRRASAETYQQIFHVDGWVESDNQIEDPDTKWRAALSKLAADWPTDAGRVEGLIKAVQAWTEEGIVVAAFCPPIPEDSHDLEAELWGIDYQQLRIDIESAGGIWVEVSDTSSYRIYDGSHLDAASARGFSRELASQVARELKTR